MRVPNVLLPTAILLAAASAGAGVVAEPAAANGGVGTTAATAGTGTGAATSNVAASAASAHATMRTDHSCYLVGTPVVLSGSGFGPSTPYEVSLDGVDFGISTTTAAGQFRATLRPGGLPANVVQRADVLRASDGARATYATIMVTRAAGARILPGSTASGGLRAPFQVWGFALGASRPPAYAVAPTRRNVYLHYVGPDGRIGRTVRLGKTGGPCGYLQTPALPVFPFAPKTGKWTLQIDTSPSYAPSPRGPVARIPVEVG